MTANAADISVKKTETTLTLRDRLGMLKMRMGIGRASYRIEPGIYAVGNPDSMSPVLVSSNYKMSFDVLRRELAGLDAWILVIDTRGINVWCAAGKGTFSAEEIARMIALTGLSRIVDHRVLILPQLSAPGVAAHEVKRASGFKAIYGPVRAADIRRFIYNDETADEEMRTVKFGMRERLALVPLEIISRFTTSIFAIVALFAASWFGAYFFHPGAARPLGLWGTVAYLAGFLAGTVLVPALLPWIPGRAFSLKGAIVGAIAGMLVALAAWGRLNLAGIASLILFASAVASYIALHFTGASTFTSPSGVEKEMRRSLPVQAVAIIVASVTWIFFARIS